MPVTLALVSSCWYDVIIGLVLSLDVSTGIGSLRRKPVDFLSSHCGTCRMSNRRISGFPRGVLSQALCLCSKIPYMKMFNHLSQANI